MKKIFPAQPLSSITLLLVFFGGCVTFTMAQETYSPPASRWAFDAEFGIVESDATGFGPDALLVRDSVFRPLSRRVPGLFGRALRPEERSLVKTKFPAGKEFTFSMWINPEKADVPCFAKLADFFSLAISGTANTVEISVGGKKMSSDMKLNEWSNLILRCDGSKAEFFLNGKIAGKADVVPPENLKGADFIFGNAGTAPHHFTGLVDEVRVYDRAVSDGQISIISDPEESFLEVPPIVDAGVDHTIYLPDNEIELYGKVSGKGNMFRKWSVLRCPKGGTAKFADPDSAETNVVLDGTGDFVLALDGFTEFGRSRATVRISVFPKPESKQGKLFNNPLRANTYGIPASVGLGNEPIFDAGFAKATFPELEFKYHMEGFEKSRFPPPPPPYQHPRIFFNHSELDDMRHRLKNTRSGQAALEKIRGAIEMSLRNTDPKAPIPPFFRLKKEGETGDSSNLNLAAIHCHMSFIAMIDADSAMARRVIDSSVKMANDQLKAIESVPEKNRSDFRNAYHNILGRYATSYTYDFLYPWMTDAERAKIRRVISGCTAGKWSVGMYAVNAHGSSNWQYWVTGDLLANVLAIEGEDGFDPAVYEECKNAMRRFCHNGIFPDGAMSEGMGKNSLAAQNLIALAKRGENLLASENVYNHATKFLPGTMQPYGYQFIEDGLWGGSRNAADPQDIACIKYAYPKDPVVDFAYRNAMGDGYTWKPRGTTYCYSSDLVSCWTASDWEGDKDWNKNAAQALKDQPLSYFSNHINLVTARSGWNKDAAFICFLPRMLGGHSAKAHGTFVFSALGRDWSLYPAGHNDVDSLQHSVITVDGKSAGAGWAKMLSFKDSPEAVFASCDLRETYGQTASSGACLNDYRLFKGNLPWEKIPIFRLPHWYDGDKPSSSGPPPESSPAKEIKSAYRTVGLIRATTPYAIVADDFNMDGAEHDYRWQMVLPPDLASNISLNDNEAVILDEKTGNRLLLKMFSAGKLNSSKNPFPEELKNKLGDVRTVSFQTRCVSPGFVAVLFPLRPGEKAPQIQWNGKQLAIGADLFTFMENGKGPRVISMKKAGADRK